MKILFFVHAFPSISETFVLNQITGLIDRGHDVRIYGWGKPHDSAHNDYFKYNLSNLTWHIARKIPHNKFKRISHAISILARGFCFRGPRIFRLLSTAYGKNAQNLVLTYCAETLIYNRSWIPEVVISHFGDNGLIANGLKAAGVIPQSAQHYIVFHAHEICTLSEDSLKRIYKPVLKSNDILLPISKLWERKLIASGANKNQVQVLHMGVDVEKFDLIKNRDNGNQVNIISVGRLVGQKGYQYAIDGIAKYASKSNKRILYTIIGEGILETQLKEQVKCLGLQDSVVFMGAQPQNVVALIMDQSDIFLLPSVTDVDGLMEGIPVALMEAMAKGLICVSTFHSAIPELIVDRESGFLCNEKDSLQISQCLTEIEQMQPAGLENIKNAARNKIVKDFNQKLLINRLSLILENPNHCISS